jgi:hypothetical protein
MEAPASSQRESSGPNGREWPCLRFSRIDVTNAHDVSGFILWLCGQGDFVTPESGSEDQMDSQRLLEALWGWQGAPRKRMARLCWQMLVRNRSAEYFDQHFTFDNHWLERQIVESVHVLSPIQKKLRWVLKGFQKRRHDDGFIGQGSWGEEWFLPPSQTAYVRKQLRSSRPDILEESSNYEDSLRYYRLPYFELATADPHRVYVGEHQQNGGVCVWIKGRLTGSIRSATLFSLSANHLAPVSAGDTSVEAHPNFH